MEHPREHADADGVSVWRLALHRPWMLRGHPDAFEHQIEQWQFGAGVKPTTCLEHGATSCCCESLEGWGGPRPLLRPLNPLRGKSRDGTFKTAAAKE